MNLTILIPCHKEENIVKMMEEVELCFPDAQIVVANDRDGRGKGWAMRTAFAHATGDVIGFIDGDMDISARMFFRLLPFLEKYDIVVGRKQIRGHLLRRMVTKFSRILIQGLFRLGIDTQTGIKIFKREALPQWKNDNFLFDLEILVKARDAGFKIIEVPVEVTPYGSTSKKLSSKNVFRSLIEAIKLWFDFLF